MKHINLETFANGAFSAQVNRAIEEVTKNIQDPNTEATATRKITVTIGFKPNQDRNLAPVGVQAKTTLAPALGVVTALQMAMYGPVEIKDEETGKKIPLTKRINVVKFKESSEVDGTLITEVKQGRDGTSIKLADRMKALDWLAEHMDMATEEQRAKIDQMRANTVRLQSVNIDDREDGVMIVNDAPRSENLGHSNSEISSDI